MKGQADARLRWHWGTDRRLCDDCGAEVYAFKEGLICSKCGRDEDDDPPPLARLRQLTPRGQSDRCTCDPDADGTTDLFCPVHGDSVSLPLTNTVEDEERASWADREPDDPPS